MTHAESDFRIETVLLCEEVRKEASGRDTILGLVPEGLACFGFPSPVRFALWMVVYSANMSVGHHVIEFEIKGEMDPEPLSKFTVGFALNAPGTGRFALHTPVMWLTVLSPGVRGLSYSLNQGHSVYLKDIPFLPFVPN